MTTDIRIRGTSEECRAFVDWMKRHLHIRSVSDWYKDNRRGQESILGRVYMSIGDIEEKNPEASEISEASEKEPGTMRTGRCHYCKQEGQLAVLMWNAGTYAGVCPACARAYLDDQMIGNFIKKEHPETYAQLRRTANPQPVGIFQDPTGSQTIYEGAADPLEGME